MTFEEFLGSARRVMPLEAAPEIEAQCSNWNEVYAVIEFGPDHEFWLLELVDEFYVDLDGREHRSGNRDDLARELYNWAIREGYLDCDPAVYALVRCVRAGICDCDRRDGGDPWTCATCNGEAVLKSLGINWSR